MVVISRGGRKCPWRLRRLDSLRDRNGPRVARCGSSINVLTVLPWLQLYVALVMLSIRCVLVMDTLSGSSSRCMDPEAVGAWTDHDSLTSRRCGPADQGEQQHPKNAETK